MQGTCQLCREEKQLVRSHFIPRALYPPKPTFVNKRIVLPTDRQVKAHLLCEGCEDLFDKKGESPVLGLIAPNSVTFPLLDKLKAARPIGAMPSMVVYSGPACGVNTDPFAYLMISLLWRAAVHQWRMSDGSLKRPLELGEDQERFRTFLLGKAPFPSDVIVVVTVCTDSLSRGSLTTPSEGTPDNPHRFYSFLARGVYFMALIGEDVPPFLRQLCCCTSDGKFIFVRNCEGKTFDPYLKLFATAKTVGKAPPYRVILGK